MTIIIHHMFKGFIKGWTTSVVNPLDVRKIIKIDYRKRLFCILDREYKYTLRIEWLEQKRGVMSQ